ncbi:membrane protein [Spiroplasma poulsonii]|nr:membrane protein [Spiroplasma poulsonii]
MFKNYFNLFRKQKNIKFSYWYVNWFMANILFYLFIVCFNLQFIYFSSTSVVDIILFIFLVIFDIIFFWSFFSNLFQMEWQGFFGQILCRVKIFIFNWC